MRALALAAALAAALPAIAMAAPSRVPLGKASILYDTSVWRATPGNGAVTFTCIAPDCMAQPHVFASVTNARDLAQSMATAQREGRRIRDDGVPPLPFAALSYPSGCRAVDAPILFAGGQIDDVAYVFVTSLTSGCNFSPPLPESRFVELLRGFETN
jgi:hypothetical protein